MKRTIFGAIALMIISLNVKAADLPAEIDYLTVSDINKDVQYITSDGKIACLDYEGSVERNDNFYYEEPLGDAKVYYSDVKSFAEPYIWEDTYYIDKNGDLYRYKIDGNIEDHSKVDGISDCVKVCCGPDYVLALRSDGTVWAWGENKYGQLGDGTSEAKEIPSKINGLEEIVDITAGDGYAYAVDSDGKVYGWGQHNLKDKEGVYDSNILPHEVMSTINDCIRIDTADDYTFVMTNSGDIYVFYNTDPRAYRMEGVDRCTDISAKPWTFYMDSPMMLAEDGKVWQWSYPKWSENGRKSAYPNETTYIDDIVKVVSGVRNMYIKSDGSVWIIRPDGGYWNHGEAVCIVDADDEYKLNTDSVRFVKRSEAADMVSKLYEETTGKVADVNSLEYNDVDADSKYKNGIQKCTSLGIMDGTDEEGNFSPNKVLRREQAAVILDRLCNLSGVELKEKTEKYDDDEKISYWAKKSVYKTAELFERRDDVYNPQEYVTYDELEGIIERITSNVG